MAKTSKYHIVRWWFIVHEYRVGSVVMMKKQHPCGTNEWEVTRVGADIKIKCIKCNRSVMIPRIEFNKKVKKILTY